MDARLTSTTYISMRSVRIRNSDLGLHIQFI